MSGGGGALPSSFCSLNLTSCVKVMKKLKGEDLWFWGRLRGCTTHPRELLSPSVISASHRGTRLRSNFRWPLPTSVWTTVICESNKYPLYRRSPASRAPESCFCPRGGFVKGSHFPTHPLLPLSSRGAGSPCLSSWPPCFNVHINLDSKTSYRRRMQMYRVIQIGFLCL